MLAIEEIHQDPFFQSWKELLQQEQPFVVRGMVSNWPIVKSEDASAGDCVNRWLNSPLQEPVTLLKIDCESKGRIFYSKDFNSFNFEPTQCDFNTAVKSINQNSRPEETGALYLGSTNIPHWLPEFYKCHPAPIDLPDATASLWLSNPCVVAPHFDFPNNLACVISGARQFLLFPPEQVENLYIGPIDFTPAGQPISLVDTRHPDLSVHPNYKIALAHAQTATLFPGDAVFIPSMWWHQIESLHEVNGLVNFWWRDDGEKSSPLAALLHAILAYKSLRPRQKSAWLALIRYFALGSSDNEFDYIPGHVRGVLGSLDERDRRALREAIRNALR